MVKKTTVPLRDNDVVSLLTSEDDYKLPTKYKGGLDKLKKAPAVVPPQKSLVPLGNGFYGTPDTPAAINDCDRWKTSPACGGSPLSTSFLGLGVDIVKSDNLVGIQFSPAFGFVRLPEYQITYGNPFTLPNEIELPDEIRVTPPTLPGRTYGLDRGFDKKQRVYCAVNFYSLEPIYERRTNCENPIQLSHILLDKTVWKRPDIDYLSRNEVDSVTAERTLTYNDRVSAPTRDPDTDCILSPGEDMPISEVTVEGQNGSSNYHLICNADGYVQRFKEPGSSTFQVVNSKQIQPQFTIWTSDVMFSGSWYGTLDAIGIIYGDWGDICKYLGRPFGGFETQNKSAVIAWVVPEDKDQPEKSSPPSLPPGRCCDMPCCPDNANLEYLLRKILEETQKANKAIGSDEMGYSVPADITDDSAGTITINSLAQAVNHEVRLKDQIAGKYPIEIEIKDTNLVEAGEQSIKLKIENQAEMQAELMGLLYQTRVTTEANLNVNARSLSETGAARNQSLQTFYLLLALAEYIGFPLEQEKREVPYAYNPEANSLDSLLKETTKEMSTFKWKGGRDLQQWLVDLGYGASLVKGALFRPTGNLQQTKELLSDLLGEDDSEAGDNKTEFDDFVRQVENGFGTIPGIDSMLVNKPYGRDFTRRPNIKELDTDGDASDDTNT